MVSACKELKILTKIFLKYFKGISFPAIYWWRTSSPHLYTDQVKLFLKIFFQNLFN